MRNAKIEFLEAVVERNVKCVFIQLGDYRVQKEIVLKVGYSENEYEEFLKQLDFNYDAGFGGQELFGTVWFDDNTWLSRGEYDGSEWWEHNELPEIPSDCV